MSSLLFFGKELAKLYKSYLAFRLLCSGIWKECQRRVTDGITILFAARCVWAGGINKMHGDEVCSYLFSHILTEYISQCTDWVVFFLSLPPSSLFHPQNPLGMWIFFFLCLVSPFWLASLSCTPARAGAFSHKGLPKLSCQGGDVIWSIFSSFINNKTPVSQGV